MLTRSLTMSSVSRSCTKTEELKALFCPIPGKSNRVAVHEQDKTKPSCESLLRWGHVGLPWGLPVPGSGGQLHSSMSCTEAAVLRWCEVVWPRGLKTGAGTDVKGWRRCGARPAPAEGRGEGALGGGALWPTFDGHVGIHPPAKR